MLTKEQIKIVLKKHSKRELLEKALAWELMANQYQKELQELKDKNNEVQERESSTQAVEETT